MPPQILLQQVDKKYRKGQETITIFEHLNLSIEAGDFIAVMGPSGSGKSTLLNLIGGIDQPDSGSIICTGVHIEQLSESQLAAWRSTHIGFIFQFYNLMPMLNAEDNVELPLLLTRYNRAERTERVQSTLQLVGLKDRAKHYPNELSGGQQQRVAIARAIVSNPDILLCDEPTGDLDRKTAAEILDMLQLLNRELGKTIIMVTHDPLAAASAKRVLHLDKGQFIENELKETQTQSNAS